MDRLGPLDAVLAAGAPRYVAVADALTRDIESGRYGLGDLLPPELDLCGRYGVSRHTVREATRRLVDMGMVSRHPGIGTRVRARRAQARYSASIGSIDALLQYTRGTRLELLAADEVDARGELARQLGCRDGQRWLRLHALRFPADEPAPLSITDLYVPPEYRDLARLVGRAGVAVYRVLERRFGERIVEVRQDIGAVAIGAAQARLLRLPARSPGLEVVRAYVGERDRVLSVSKNTYPAGRFRLSARWRVGRAER